MKLFPDASIIKCNSWLIRFLERKGLKKPDNRPLYKYHATSDEYHELKNLLKTIGKSNNYKNDKSYVACFTLFCSEWYRRDYEQHNGWSWEPIYKILGISLSPTELRLIIPRGLETFWGRPVRFYDSERRNFLGSVFSEGGLPFRLLKAPDSRFKSVFSQILNQFEQFQYVEFSTLELVQSIIKKSSLPIVFQEDTSVELISSMADELRNLVKSYDLNNNFEPVQKLDQVNPKWRDSFSIPLDDETGTNLINSLLQTASVETKPRLQKNRITSCKFLWSESQPNQIRAILCLPCEIKFSLLSDPSTTRFEIAIYENDDEIVNLGPAYATLENTSANVRLRRHTVEFVRKDPSANLYLVANIGGMTIGLIKVEQSDVIIGDYPLIFVLEDNKWLLAGQASCYIKNSDVLIILPKGSQIISENNHLESADKFFGLDSIRVEGRQDIVIKGNEIYRISIGREQAKSSDFLFLGKQLNWTCAPESTFLGIPKIIQKQSNAEINLQNYFISGKNIDKDNLQETLGEQFVSARNDKNETLFRRKIGILPDDFNVYIKCGDQPNKGSIIITTQHKCLFSVKDKRVKFTLKKFTGSTEIQLQAESYPPAFVQLQVKPNLLSNPIEIIIPFPASGCLIFDSNGKPLPDRITTNDLLGSRAYLFGNNGVSTKFRLELQLNSKKGVQAWYEWNYKTNERPIELNLYSLKENIENLFSLESGIDQVVDMRIDGAGKSFCIQIRRYKYKLDYDSEKQLLLINSDRNVEQHPSLLIMLLSEPERKPISIQSRKSENVSVGEYELGSIINKSGPWLIIPKRGEESSFRPCFIRGERLELKDTNNIRSLQKATQLFEPYAEINIIKTVLDQMVKDLEHSGWKFLRNLYDNFGYLALPTFEVWRALVQHPKALALSFFKFEMLPKYLNRIESEFPIFWEFLSIFEIKSATEQFRSFLGSKNISGEIQTKLIKQMYQQLELTFSTYSDDVFIWLNEGKLPQKIPIEVMKSIISNYWYQDLLHKHCNSNWPDYGNSRLYLWFLKQTDPIIDITSEPKYRLSVLLLPIFAASVASGKTTFESVFGDKPGAVFFLRQVRDFDSSWFDAMFKYSLLCNINE